MKIPFSPPYIDESVISEVVDALRSGWITTGPKVKALEAEIAKLNESKAVLGVNSWTSGAILVLRWLGIQPGDEVIIPAYTYCATAMAVEWAGGKVVMVDSGDDFNISVEAIRKAITPRTKAIIPVDIAGFPCDYEAIMRLVNSPEIKAMFVPASEVQEKLQRILVVNDSAHSLGAYNNGRRSGSQTDIAIFSLHAVKNVTTSDSPKYASTTSCWQSGSASSIPMTRCSASTTGPSFRLRSPTPAKVLTMSMRCASRASPNNSAMISFPRFHDMRWRSTCISFRFPCSPISGRRATTSRISLRHTTTIPTKFHCQFIPNSTTRK